MDSPNNRGSCYSMIIVFLKAKRLIIGLLTISTIFWIIGCEMVWYGTLWIEDVYKLQERFYIYKIITRVLFLGLGILTVVISAALVLLGIPFTLVHVDHVCHQQQQVQISNISPKNNEEVLTRNSKNAFKWTVSIFILVIVGLVIGGVGFEVMQWSGVKFRAVFTEKKDFDKIPFYFEQCLFLIIMFAGLLLSFIGLLLAPFTLAFAGVVSFDKKRNSYRLRPRRRRRQHLSMTTSEI